MVFHALSDAAGGGTAVLDPPDARRRSGQGHGGGPPPDRGDGGGGGGDPGPWDGEPAGEGPGAGARELGFLLALISMGTLFLVFLGGFLVLRRQAGDWPPPGSPPPPTAGLWIPTLLLGVCSALLVVAVRARRAGDGRPMRRALIGATAAGVAFLLAQVWLWRELIAEGLVSTNAYGAVFYSLTGLHAAHVVGGLVFLCAVLLSVGRPPAAPPRKRGAVELCATYWHFLGAIWIVLFGVLTLG